MKKDDYSLGKVYMIYSPGGEEGDIYIGTTKKPYLCNRMTSHRSNYRSWKAGKRTYVSVFKLFDKYGIENCIIELLENVKATTKHELLAREGYYIRTMECVNKSIAGRSIQEYYEDNKEKIIKRTLQYYKDNKENIKVRSSKYYEENKEKINVLYTCECGRSIIHQSKSRHEKTNAHQTNIKEEIKVPKIPMKVSSKNQN